jgi:hypothetical protein
LHGIEAMNMIGQAQVQAVKTGDIMSQVQFGFQIFAVAASRTRMDEDRLSSQSFCNTTV